MSACAPPNPPPPAGWRALDVNVTADMQRWAASMLSRECGYVETREFAPGVIVGARREWHSYTALPDGNVAGSYQGVTLYRASTMLGPSWGIVAATMAAIVGVGAAFAWGLKHAGRAGR